MHGEIKESSSECFAGQSTKACCKHMIATLFAINDHHQMKPIITAEACTDTLQTWHHPTKRHHGSPIKTRNMVKIKKTDRSKNNLINKFSENETTASKLVTIDTGANKSLSNANYKDYFYNLIKSRCFDSNMTIKQLMEPANPFGLANDHNYCKQSFENMILKSLNLINISDEDIEIIEESTLLQNESEYWHECRKVRLTASKFFALCKNLNEKQGMKMAKSILNSVSFKSKYTAHGQIYEKVAIQKFESDYLKY